MTEKSKKIGYALSGGGARGIGHLGTLKALEERDIRPDIISGTSSGAIIGSLYSYGYSPDEILKMIEETRVFATLKPAMSLSGLLKIDNLKSRLQEVMPEDDFTALKNPMIITATDVEGGTTKYFESGKLAEKIVASCCVPVFFNPVKIDDLLLVDGGVLDNLPASVLRGRCDFIIGSHTNPIVGRSQVKNMKNIIERSLLMAINGNTIKSKEFCDMVLEPPELGKFSGFDIKKAKIMVKAAYEYSSQWLDENKKKWESLSVPSPTQ